MLKTYYHRYGIWGIHKLILSYVLTKIFFRQSRLIRFPVDIRNKHLIDLGVSLTTGVGCRIEAYNVSENKAQRIIFGANIQINDYVHISAGESVIISDNVLIASKVFITDINHGNYNYLEQDNPDLNPSERKLNCSPVFIGENVWIGENVCILPGVNIGFGSIIGSGSIVTKDIPPESIAVGVPCKVIKSFDRDMQKWIKI
jgi:acetyltransferase-like isoleucine patch superfamily enzyme